jgi:hypothetical protein
MAYYIFLKSLRSLEEFRKNPHAKIPPKSPSTNFQSLGKFKNSQNFSTEFGPTRPSRSPVPYVQPRPAPPQFRSHAAAPPPPGLPWPQFLPAPVLPLPLYSLAITPPFNHALTRCDEPEITRPLNATSSPAVTRLHRLGAPPPAL